MADFNPVQSFNQGTIAGQNILESQRQNQIRALQQSLSQQSGQGGFNPNNSLEFQQLAALDPNTSAKILSTFQSLDDSRKSAAFEDARKSRQFLEAGDGQGFLNVVQDRIGNIERLGGDSTGSKSVLDTFNSGDIEGTIAQLKQTEQIGVDLGFLKSTGGGPVSVQSAKILDDGTVIEVLKGGGRQVISPSGEILTGDAARTAIGTSRDQAHDRKIELKKLDQTIKRTQQKEGLLNDQQKSIQRSNIRRLGELSSTSSGRNSAVKKATKFKMALESGNVHSGAGRKGLSFVPGVFTSQGQFDEEFNAFAEVAARQTLKASGETRPTDADVQGMKQAMFGIGRDETVNIQLLTDFIKDQHAQTSELDQLIDASKGGSLSNFTFTPTTGAVNVGELSDEDLFN